MHNAIRTGTSTDSYSEYCLLFWRRFCWTLAACR